MTVLAVTAGTCTALLLPAIGSGDAHAASLGQLQISPTTGEAASTASTIFSTSAACPATSTDFVITMTGANLPEGVNAIGNSSLPEDAIGAPLVNYPLANTWNSIVTGQGGTAPIDGVATLTMICAGPGGNEGEFAATVTFVKAASGVDSTYTVGGSAAPSPSPSPVTSLSPSPSPSPSPSTSASPSASPSPAPSRGAEAGETDGEGTGEECDTEASESIEAGDEPADGETEPADEPIDALSAAAGDTAAAATESADAATEATEAVTETTEAVTETAEDTDCAVPVDTDTSTDTGTSSGDSLPDTGRDNPSQMLLTAGLFAIAGFLLLMFEAATRMRNGHRYDPEAVS